MGNELLNNNEYLGMDAIFESLGRAIFMLDASFKICYAGNSTDALLCEGASEQMIGMSLQDIFQTSVDSDLHQLVDALSAGKREEGRRAFIRCPSGKTRLVSITAAPFTVDYLAKNERPFKYFIVIRPAEQDSLILQRATTSIGFVARSPSMLRIVHTIEALHRSDATTLITGESGTGKEVVAKALHMHSPRRDAPFIAVNCAAFPGELLESELFGHARGAFTGAVRDKAGRFELAAEGTIFLDEIGDMPLNLQVKLLRVIQEKQFFRLGDTKTRKVRARIVAATNVNLEQAIIEDRFREDLYYRLKVVPIHIPPLRERPEDIEVLAKHLLSKVDSRLGKRLFLSPDTLKILQKYPWPGNVRELENILEYAATFSKGQFVQVDDLPPEIIKHRVISPSVQSPDTYPMGGSGEACPTPLNDPYKAYPTAGLNEKEQLIQVLELTHWNRSVAAKKLHMSRTTLWRKMKRYGLD